MTVLTDIMKRPAPATSTATQFRHYTDPISYQVHEGFEIAHGLSQGSRAVIRARQDLAATAEPAG